MGLAEKAKENKTNSLLGLAKAMCTDSAEYMTEVGKLHDHCDRCEGWGLALFQTTDEILQFMIDTVTLSSNLHENCQAKFEKLKETKKEKQKPPFEHDRYRYVNANHCKEHILAAQEYLADLGKQCCT